MQFMFEGYVSSQVSGPTHPTVVGFDGSDGARRAVRWAATEASIHTHLLVIVHAVHPHIATTAYGWDPAAELGDARLTDEARAAVEPLAAELIRSTPGLHVEMRFPQNEPAHAMMDVSTELGAESMVVGASGLSAVPRIILGSTAADLVRIADRPIVVVRGDGGDSHDGSTVLVGLDANGTNERVLAYAFGYAAAHGTSLHAVHGLPGRWVDPMIPRVQSPPDSADTPAAAAAEMVGRHLDDWRSRFPHVPADLEIVETTPARALLERSSQASLVVVGSHQRGALRRTFLGSVSHAMVYHADCPVAVIPLAESSTP